METEKIEHVDTSNFRLRQNVDVATRNGCDKTIKCQVEQCLWDYAEKKFAHKGKPFQFYVPLHNSETLYGS